MRNPWLCCGVCIGDLVMDSCRSSSSSFRNLTALRNSPRDKLPPRYRLVFARLPRAVPVAPTPLPPLPPSALHSLLASKAPPEPTPAAPGESIWGNCPHNLPVTVHPRASPVPIAADDVALCVSYRASAKQIARPKPSRRGDLTWPAVACDSGTYAYNYSNTHTHIT